MTDQPESPKNRRAGRIQLAGSILVAVAIATGTVAAVTAKLGTTSVAALEAQEERADRAADAREDRAKERERRAKDREDAREDRAEEREDAAGER